MSDQLSILWKQYYYWLVRDVKVALDVKEEIRKIQSKHLKSF